jgi:hypothetical protein
MTLLSSLKQIEKRYAWSLLGVILAILFGILAVYTDFWRDRRPELRFQIVSDASVLDVREQLGNLEVIYDGMDIQKAQKSLRVIVVRVINEGPDDILKTHYDDNRPLGFRVAKGTLIRAEVLTSSSPYLQDSLNPVHQPPDRVVFSPVILEAGEWFTIKSLILHPEEDHPIVRPLGKIAGVRDIKLIDPIDATAQPGLLNKAFSGELLVQAARLPAYFFGFILLIMTTAIPIGVVPSALSSRRRRKDVSQFKAISKLPFSAAVEFLFKRYIEHGIECLEHLQQAISHDKLGHEARRDERGTPLRSDASAQSSASNQSALTGFMTDMHAAGFITPGAQGWQADPHLRQTLDEFVSFVKLKRAA